MTLGAVTEPRVTHRPTVEAARDTPEATASTSPDAAQVGTARTPATDEQVQGTRQLMQGIGTGLGRSLLEQLDNGRPEAGIKRPCGRGGRCMGSVTRGLTPPNPTT